MLKKKKQNILKIFFILIFLIFLLSIGNTTYASGDYGFNFKITNDGGVTMNSPYAYNGNDVLNTNVSRGIVWNALIGRYKVLIVGFVGIVALTLIVFAMVGFVKIANDGENPQKKRDNMLNLGLILFAGMLLGAGTLLFGYAFNVFRK